MIFKDKMKVAINNLPLKNAHKNRGIGYYTNCLIDNLRQDSELEVSEFTKLSDVKNAQVIHYPWFDLFFHTLPIMKNYPTVITIHDVIPLIFSDQYPIGIKGRVNLFLQKLSLGNCKHLITDSETSKKDIIKYLKVESKKITVVHLAADSSFIKLSNSTRLLFVKRKYQLPEQFLLYVGDANWVKNLPFLIESFYHLVKLPNFSDVKLVLIGGVFLKNVDNINHPELVSLRLVNKLIKQYGLENHVIKPGQVEKEILIAFYNLATIYIQPSFYEGFGLPVLQAFACGAPVVCANKGSLPEIGGRAAVYFDPTNSIQFLSITREILENKSLQNKLSKLSMEQAAKYSWEKTIEETKAVYQKVINNE